jgi:hypothetical protein
LCCLIAGLLIGCGDATTEPADAKVPDSVPQDSEVLPDGDPSDTPDTVVDVDPKDTETVEPDDGPIPDSADTPTPIDGDTPDGGPVDPPTEDQKQLLLFINHLKTTKSVLIGEVGLKGQTPGAIIDYRAGPDGAIGSADDVTIDSIQELDELPYVGKTSLDKLQAFAHNWSEDNTDPVLLLLNAPSLTLVELDTDIGLDNDAAVSLIAYRAGDDGQVGTADDQFFVCRYEVLAVKNVGKAAIRQLEEAVGLGSLELMDSGTSSNLTDLVFNDIGEALIVGIPVGINAHAIWFTPFSEEAYTTEDTPYEFLDFSEVMPEALIGVDFDVASGMVYAVGEVAGLYVLDTFTFDATFLENSDVESFSDVAVDPMSGDVYAASAEAEVIVRYDAITLTAEIVATVAVNAISFTGSPPLLTGVGDGGTVTIFDAGGPTPTTIGSTEYLYGVFSTDEQGQRMVVGDAGLATLGTSDWARLSTRTLRPIRAGARSPDGTHLLLVGQGGTVLRYDLAGNGLASLTSPVSVDFSSVAFAVDGTALIVGDAGVVLQYVPVEP